MKRHALVFPISAAIMIAFLGFSCGSNDPMSPFNPEVTNNPDNFQFQITAAQNLDRAVDYTWENSSGQATVNQSCAITGGTAVVTLIDSTGTTLYTRNLSEDGTFESTAGVAGFWTIRLHFSDLDGTVNFRVQTM